MSDGESDVFWMSHNGRTGGGFINSAEPVLPPVSKKTA